VRFQVKNHREWYYTGNGWIMARVLGYGLTVERVREPNPAVMLRLAPEQQYSVALRDAENRPLTGVTVCADSLNTGGSQFPVKWLGYVGKTDARGEYHVSGLPAGKPPWFDWDRGKYALYHTDRVGTRTTLTLGPRYSLAGTVYSPDGKPADNKINVDILPVEGTDSRPIDVPRTIRGGKCDSKGRYRVDGLIPGEYRVSVFRWGGGDLMRTDSRRVSVTANTPVLRADLRLTPLAPGGVPRVGVGSYGLPSGIVTNRAGKPVPDAEVSWVAPVANHSFVFPSRKEQKVLTTVKTDRAGRFAFRSAPGTPAHVVGTKQFRRDHSSDVSMVRADGYGLGASPMRFRKGGNFVTLAPPQAHSVSFRDANGKPVVGLPVWVDALADASPWTFIRLKWFGYGGKTDGSGTYRVAGLPRSETVRWDFDQSRHRVLRSQRSGGNTIITLGQGRTLEGTIRLPDGTPAKKQILVSARPMIPAASYIGRDASADENGRYRITGLAPGPHRVHTSVLGDRTLLGATPLEIEMPEAGSILQRDLIVQRAAKVAGRVTDTDGKPMAHLEVSNRRDFQLTSGYHNGEQIVTNSTGTDADGTYELYLPVGEAQVSVASGDTRTVLVREDDSARLDFVVSRKNIPTITGRVLDTAGKPVVWNDVILRHGKREYGTSTKGNGYFKWQCRVTDDSPITVFVKRGTEGAVARVVPGDETPLMLRLSKAAVGYFAGQLVDTAGKPIASPMIQL
ncbi:MAG: hypothetical protein H7145_11215, partial [Akkermansiaceae bacterium]|nr:hypothetical protein [Armatimonadota bacterium]